MPYDCEDCGDKMDSPRADETSPCNHSDGSVIQRAGEKTQPPPPGTKCTKEANGRIKKKMQGTMGSEKSSCTTNSNDTDGTEIRDNAITGKPNTSRHRKHQISGATCGSELKRSEISPSKVEVPHDEGTIEETSQH